MKNEQEVAKINIKWAYSLGINNFAQQAFSANYHAVFHFHDRQTF